MTTSENWRRAAVAIVALLTGCIVFWTALHCSGSDWFISETHADIIYSGLQRFNEFPFFSFAVNGGTYFLQDPQSNLFSPAVPLILLAGPSIGLRLMEGIWGVLGVYAFVVWMRRHVRLEAALIGGVASATSLGVLWKVAAGNDMFLWHLGLPALLWAVESVLRDRSVRSALALGLVLGLLLLGPTFHSFAYLFLPVVSLFVVFELARARPTLPVAARIALLFGGALALALLIASFKLASWASFPMSRPIADQGVIGVRDAIRGLLNYSLTKHSPVATTRITLAGNQMTGAWGLAENAAALPPLASCLALISVLWSYRIRANRGLLIFAGVLLALGISLACSWPLWSTFRSLTGGGFRVAPRFLGVAAFGLTILATLGAEVVFGRWSRAVTPLAGAAIALMLGSAVWWTLTAAGFAGASSEDTVQREAMNPIRVSAQERATMKGLTGITKLVKFSPQHRYIPEGIGYKDGFMVVGNRFKERLWKSRARPDAPVPVVVEVEPNERGHRGQATGLPNVIFTHLSITVMDLAPHTQVRLRALQPSFGLTTRLRPLDADVVVKKEKSYLVVENRGDAPVRRVRLRADLPISRAWFFVSLIAGLGAIWGLAWPRLRRGHATH